MYVLKRAAATSVVLLVISTIGAYAATVADAGTYPWVICGNNQPLGSAESLDHVSLKAAPGASASVCYQNNNSTNSLARTNDFSTFLRVEAPTGTTVTTVNLEAVGNNYAFNRGWGYLAYTLSTPFNCSYYENQFVGASCGEGVAGFSTHGPKPLLLPASGDGSVYIGLYCRNLGGCDVGTLDLQIPYLSVELRDDTRPTLDLDGPAWSGPALSGTPLLKYATHDNASGAQGIRVLIDGQEKTNTVSVDSGGCDSTRWHFCPDDVGAIQVPLNGVADGTRTLTVRTEDAVGNVSNDSSRTVLVDNVPPVVGDVSLTGIAREGEMLQCAASVEGQTPTVARQWSRTNPDGSREKDIVAATAGIYVPTAEDVGKKLLCRVTGIDGGGSATKKSSLTSGPFADGALVAAKAIGLGAGGLSGGNGASGTNGAVGGNGAAGNSTGAAAAAAAAVPACTSATVEMSSSVTMLTRSYNRSSVTLSGRLVGRTGDPEADQVLDLVQTVVRAGTATRSKIGSVRTATNGSFRAVAPPGPSRALQLVDRGCGSVGRIVAERVRGLLYAKTTTRRVRNRQTARITGRVVGGYVGRGIPLELQVKIGRQWRDVKHTTSTARGDFRVAYRFMRTYVRYTYRFRVVTRAGGAWPYMPAKSDAVKVRVN